MSPDDLFELEAEMSGASRWGSEWDAKVERAKARVEAFNRLPRAQQIAPCDRTCLIPEMIRIATRIPATIEW